MRVMTENLLVKLEEKTMVLLSEIEELRKQVQRLTLENATFKMEKETNTRKVQDLISLLDSANPSEFGMPKHNVAAADAILIQG
jgi:regulator of replication initiation timing